MAYEPPKPSNPQPTHHPSQGAATSQAGSGAAPSLATSLRVLEEKLSAAEGIEPLVSLLAEIENLLTGVSEESLATSRQEIRAVIDRLLAINGELQNLGHLKKLLP